MDKSIRIAAEIIAIAKSLITGADKNGIDEFESLKHSANLDGFEREFGDEEITFTWKDDESGSCNIVFGESEGEWGYVVNINGEEAASYTAETPREAWEKLTSKINSYVQLMEKEFKRHEEESMDAGADRNLGTCSIEESDDDSFNVKDNAFRYMMSEGNNTYELTFNRLPDVGKRELSRSLKAIFDYLDMMMPVEWKKGSDTMKFKLINQGDMRTVKSIIKNAGWTLE